jgi:hypothetical protein
MRQIKKLEQVRWLRLSKVRCKAAALSDKSRSESNRRLKYMFSTRCRGILLVKKAIRVILISFFFCFSAATQATLAAQDAASQQKNSNWMTYYYAQKQPDKMVSFLQWIEKSGIFDKHKQSTKPVAAFISVVFSDNPKRVKGWVEQVHFTGKARSVIEYALWLSGNEKIITEVFKETPGYAKIRSLPLSHLSTKRPSDLDMMWGAFFASGNTVYVKKIIDILDDNISLTGNKNSDMVTRHSAEWSLASNMMQHERVNRFVREEANSRTGVIKSKLEKIIASNDKNLRFFPNRNGNFSALLSVIDEKDLKEFEKPFYKMVKINELSKTKRGDAVAIKIAFLGMELTDDLRADVTFDLKVLDPDDKVYNKTDLKNLEARKIKTPTRFRVFYNRAFVKILFEEKDKLGKYKISVMLHDNVGKRKIHLHKEIELTE